MAHGRFVGLSFSTIFTSIDTIIQTFVVFRVKKKNNNRSIDCHLSIRMYMIKSYY